MQFFLSVFDCHLLVHFIEFQCCSQWIKNNVYIYKAVNENTKASSLASSLACV